MGIHPFALDSDRVYLKHIFTDYFELLFIVLEKLDAEYFGIEKICTVSSPSVPYVLSPQAQSEPSVFKTNELPHPVAIACTPLEIASLLELSVITLLLLNPQPTKHDKTKADATKNALILKLFFILFPL
jgi:hypothetical protein